MHTAQRNLACINRTPLQALPRQLQAALQQLPHRVLLRTTPSTTWLYGQDSVVGFDGFGGLYGKGDHEQQKASKNELISAQKRGSAITDPTQWLINKSKQVARNALVAFSTFKKSPFLAIQQPYREVTTGTCGLECHKRPPRASLPPLPRAYPLYTNAGGTRQGRNGVE
jgi:hypothetical protein